MTQEDGSAQSAAPLPAASSQQELQDQQHAPPSRVALQLGHSGLGLFISKEGPGPFVITRLIQGGAAARSGQIRVGDVLHAIGTTSLYELSEQQAKALIRGMSGPGVTLWIARSQAHLDRRPRNVIPIASSRSRGTSPRSGDLPGRSIDGMKDNCMGPAYATDMQASAMRLQIRTLEQELREVRQKEQSRLQEFDALQEELASALSKTVALKAQVDLLQMQGCGTANGEPNTQPEVGHSTVPFKSDQYDVIGRVVVEDGVVRMQTEDEVTVVSSVTDSSSSGTTLAERVLADHSVPRSVDALLYMDDKALQASGLTAQVLLIDTVDSNRIPRISE